MGNRYFDKHWFYLSCLKQKTPANQLICKRLFVFEILSVELVGFEPTSGQVGDKLSTCVVTY